MNYPLLFRTVKYLKPTQVFYQVKNRLIKPAYMALEAPKIEVPNGLKTESIARYTSWDGNQFTFLNLEHGFAGWNYTENGMLWAYNQNYFDWINQERITQEECCYWIDKFIEELPTNRIGLDPYPIALRSINWIKFFCRYVKCATKARLDSLYSQLRLLEKKLEYHLLGNHLLEDAYALYIGGAFFHDERMLKKATKLLLSQLKEQVLPDGAHYEQSAMYHSIMLDRLLDTINISERCAINGAKLRKYAELMLGHLESIVWADGSIPMMNDSANGIAPTSKQIFDYAMRLGMKWYAIPMKECGYRKLLGRNFEAILDVGNNMATYQPGHSHADTFNYELRIKGKPFIVDTGVSTYNKDRRRQYERSTAAHNTVCVKGKNSSEVWGGFRIGKRAKVTITEDFYDRKSACHDGYGKGGHKRSFSQINDSFKVEDETLGLATGYIHFSPDVTVKEWGNSKITTNLAVIELLDVVSLDLLEEEVSNEFNMRVNTKAFKFTFNKIMGYIIYCI